MNAFLKRNIILPLTIASILATGFVFVWLAATMTLFAIVAPVFESSLRGLDEKTTAFAWFMALYLLSPLSSAILLFGIQPLIELQHFRAHPHLLNLDWLANYRLPMLAICSFFILVAVFFYRRHQKFYDRGALPWAIFIAIWGLPGIVGYLLHRRWPPMDQCQHCHELSPRDRDTCLHCQAPFPPPAMKGIEIFA